jgi:hypothetical protein
MSELIAHLEAQLASAERLLANVNAQTEAIKTQDVPTLMARLGDIQQEITIRKRIEAERERLILAGALRRGLPRESVDLEVLLEGLPKAEAEQARGLSKQLKSILEEVARNHANNRTLIRQELTFVDHLIRVITGAPQPGYSPGGWTNAGPRPVVSVDARA